MSNVNMPSSTEQAVAALEAKCRLSAATEWEKAALIAMLVGPPRPGYTDAPYSTSELAALGFHGLRSESTVRRYRDAWFLVRGDMPRSGEPLELPDEDFPEAPETIRKRQQKEAQGARAGVAMQAVVAEVARHHDVAPDEVRASESLMRVVEFVDVRSREAAQKFHTSVGEEARRMLPALYAEAGDGDVVTANRRARSVNEREWEARIYGVPRQWEKVADLLGRGQHDAALALMNWLTDPANPRLDGVEVVLRRLAEIKEVVWVMEAKIGTSESASKVA